MTSQAIDNQKAIADIRADLQAGRIDYATAAERAKPVIDRINATGKALAKKHGMRPKLITFQEVMR